MNFLIATVLGFALMFPLGWLFGTMNWPMFHAWGLAHGAFIIAWPLLTLISWVVIRVMRMLARAEF
jgi:hypothetical protein